MSDGREPLSEEEDREKQRADRKAALAWLGTLGTLGWLIAAPILLGVLLGRWLDGRLASGYVFTLALVPCGLAVAGFGAWRWIRKRIEDEGR